MDKLMAINNAYINDGFEGSIVKDPKGLYAFKRSTCWLKLKAVNSITLEVTDVEMGKGKREGKIGALICKSKCSQINVKLALA